METTEKFVEHFFLTTPRVVATIPKMEVSDLLYCLHVTFQLLLPSRETLLVTECYCVFFYREINRAVNVSQANNNAGVSIMSCGGRKEGKGEQELMAC